MEDNKPSSNVSDAVAALHGSAAAAAAAGKPVAKDPNSQTNNNDNNITGTESTRHSTGQVEFDGSFKSDGKFYPTPAHTSVGDATSERARRKAQSKQQQVFHPVFGIPVNVETSGKFPTVGSTLGPYFCLGQLGKGTFSSIHKCINLAYFHHDGNNQQSQQSQTQQRPQPRVAAAKVELQSFSQSGVLESEAMMLDFLNRTLPKGTVPVYMGHYKSGDYAAIVMEYLPGEDMHCLREQVMSPGGRSSSRRMALEDAVYLTAEVMLPLLQRMHEVGVVHRDVKPSNCVRSSTSGDNKDFCMVDFGLSKSIIVPEESPVADKEHPWDDDQEWLRPQNYTGKGYFRKERPKADFRGTSMYASLRVHQLRDYCPRDDIWSLLYVFCDLVSGGLPWMSYAANRDRAMCQKLKERVHGDTGNPLDEGETELLLMGDEYHVASFRRERQKASGDATSRPLIELPEPLLLSRDAKRVGLLREAFRHLKQVEFWQRPNYALIQSYIRGFLEEDTMKPPPVRRIDWLSGAGADPSMQRRDFLLGAGKAMPKWNLEDDVDPLEPDIFDDVDESEKKGLDEDSLARLPLELRFRVIQMEYNASRPQSVPKHTALRDWMKVTLPLLYGEWDTPNFEGGGHRTATDGLKRNLYLDLLERCRSCATEFDNFRSRECYFLLERKGLTDPRNSSLEDGRMVKKRKITTDSSSDSCFVNVSRALFGLGAAIRAECLKKDAPPVSTSLSFS